MITILSFGAFVGLAVAVLAIAGIASFFNRVPPSKTWNFDPKRPHPLDKYFK